MGFFTAVVRYFYAVYRASLVALVFFFFWGVAGKVLIRSDELLSFFDGRVSIPAGLLPGIPVCVGSLVVWCWQFQRALADWTGPSRSEQGSR